MAASEAELGYGTLFAKETSSGSGTYSTFAGVEVTSVQVGGTTVSAIDVTHMESPDAYMEFIPGLLDPGEFSLDFNWVPKASDALLTTLAGRAKESYRVTWPNGVTWTFTAFCTGRPVGAPDVNGVMTGTATFKASGPITVA